MLSPVRAKGQELIQEAALYCSQLGFLKGDGRGKEDILQDFR